MASFLILLKSISLRLRLAAKKELVFARRLNFLRKDLDLMAYFSWANGPVGSKWLDSVVGAI